MSEHPIESRIAITSDCDRVENGQKQPDSSQKQADSDQKQTCSILRSCIYLRYTSPLQDAMVETSKGVARGGTLIETSKMCSQRWC